MEVQNVKRALNKTVRLPDGSKYKFTGATIRLNDMGEYRYQAELQDLAALRSVRICKLEDIEIVGGKT